VGKHRIGNKCIKDAIVGVYYIAQNRGLLNKKGTKTMMNFIQHNTMATFYNVHFMNYIMGRKQVTQLTPTILWKQIYLYYQTTYPNSTFVEKTLEDHLCNTLKKLKTRVEMKRAQKEQHSNARSNV